MGKDKEEGIVLVKHTPEYQQKRKSRKKEHHKMKHKKEAAVAKKPSTGQKKKTGEKKESKHRKQRKTHKKKSKNDAVAGGGQLPESGHKKKTKKKSEKKEKKQQPLAGKQSMEMVQGRKEKKEKSLVKQISLQEQPVQEEKKTSQKDMISMTAIEKAPSTAMDPSNSEPRMATAKEPMKEEAYLAGQLAVLASDHQKPKKAPDSGKSRPSAEVIESPAGAPPPDQQKPKKHSGKSRPSAEVLDSPVAHQPPPPAALPSQPSAPPSQKILRREPSVNGFNRPVITVESQEVVRQRDPVQIGLNVDEVLRLGALMDRYGSNEARKHSFEWLAKNRMIIPREPGRTSFHLMQAVGDVECDRQLALNSFQELQRAGTLTAEEVTRLLAILDTHRGPITVGQMAQLVHTEGAYYRGSRHQQPSLPNNPNPQQQL